MKKISRLISVIHRHGMRFFDWSLADTEIGPGQQFFLVCIYENPGISMQKLAKIGHFDKGTVTKAVKKMEDQGYLRREPDVCDKRDQSADFFHKSLLFRIKLNTPTILGHKN